MIVEQKISGFQGAVFKRGNGSGIDWVIAITGTQPTEGYGVDVVADLGFGGNLSPIATLSTALLSAQCACATAMLKTVRGVAPRNDRIVITGHSLGGGVAQIVGAANSIAALAISAPAVTAVEGVFATWQKNQPQIVCLRVRNDPINHTDMLGSVLGRTVWLESPRTGGDAHSIEKTAIELSPHGQFTTLGQSDPFAVSA